MQLVITMPVRDDWESAFQLCSQIDDVLRSEPEIGASILLVDDGSTTAAAADKVAQAFQSVQRISVLELRRNLGHQRAIAVALTHLQQSAKGDAVVVMDADGEDAPADIVKLLRASASPEKPIAVFAERGKRLETATFRAFYQAYRAIHRMLTGRDIRFGNFSVVPWPYLETLVVFPELWNHYAGTFLKSGLPYMRVPCDRGRRLAGKSRMSFVNLVVHGMSGLFANQELVGTRLMIMVLLTTAALLCGIFGVIGIRLFTHLAIPGWATNATGLLLVLIGQALIAAFLLVFSIMMNRSQLGFLPIRDYAYFVRREVPLYPR
jgi:polyisoprenyl-phosphate glycosyltransferase